ERLPARRLARLRRERRGDRPRLRGGGRPDHGHGGLAAGPDRRQGRPLEPGRGGGGGTETAPGGGGARGGLRSLNSRGLSRPAARRPCAAPPSSPAGSGYG